MTEQSTQSIMIGAAPAAVMAVVADFPNYAAWASPVTNTEVLATGSDGRAERVAFTLDAGVFKDQYELRYTWCDDQRVDWELVSGKMMRAQTGSYVLEPQADGTLVTYSLTVDLAVPMLGLLKRKAERVVMDTALKALKRRVESGTA
jgi:hypothetical protein